MSSLKPMAKIHQNDAAFNKMKNLNLQAARFETVCVCVCLYKQYSKCTRQQYIAGDYPLITPHIATRRRRTNTAHWHTIPAGHQHKSFR